LPFAKFICNIFHQSSLILIVLNIKCTCSAQITIFDKIVICAEQVHFIFKTISIKEDWWNILHINLAKGKC
jgi:hypothetical protein